LLGFAHEEEFEIIGLCAGSNYCLELMSAYALTVIAAIVGLTLLLVAGYQQYEEEIEQYTPYLPIVSAAVLIIVGVGFITGLF
jgi:nickel/cobalt exporter